MVATDGACRKSTRERSAPKPFKSGKKQNSGAKVASTEQTKKENKRKKTGGKAKVSEKVVEEVENEEEEEEEEEGGEGEGGEEVDEEEDDEGEEEEEGNDSEDEDDEDEDDIGVDEAEREAEDCGRKKLQKAAQARKKVHMTHIYGFFCFKLERSPDSALPSADQLYCNA